MVAVYASQCAAPETVPDGLDAVVDSGAEVHIIAPQHRHVLTNVRAVESQQIETAAGDIELNEMGDVDCGSSMLKNCLADPLAQQSLLSASQLEDEGWAYLQGRGRAALVKKHIILKLTRCGGLNICPAPVKHRALAVRATGEV